MHTQFVFTGTGTSCDLLPMLAVARELLARGQDCHVLGNESAAPLATEQGVPFTSVAPSRAHQLTGVEANLGKRGFPPCAPTVDFIERALRRSSRLVVISSDHYAASTLMCERLGLPLCRLVLTPSRMRSVLAARWPRNAMLQYLNRERRRLHLAPIDTLRALDPLVDLHICMFPDWYCPPAANRPRRLEVVGFPLPDARGRLPQRLLEFIAREGAPIVFSPGAGETDVTAFFREARHTCELMNMPGIFLSPRLQREIEDWGRVVCFDHLELGLVLSRSALLVHHGDISATARALEAKVPQVICPRADDQPDNARRVTSLGVGASIEPAQWTATTLTRSAAELLANADVHARLEALGNSIRASNAITRAADIIIERFLPQLGEAERARRSSEAQPELEKLSTVLARRSRASAMTSGWQAGRAAICSQATESHKSASFCHPPGR